MSQGFPFYEFTHLMSLMRWTSLQHDNIEDLFVYLWYIGIRIYTMLYYTYIQAVIEYLGLQYQKGPNPKCVEYTL